MEYTDMPPLYALDEYESCLTEENSTYCMLQLNLFAEPGNKLMDLINGYSANPLKQYDYGIIDRGVCVRKTCQKFINQLRTTEELTDSLEACLNDSLHREYGLSAKVSTLYNCDYHNEPHHIDAWDWIVLMLTLGLVIMNIVASFYDYRMRKHTVKIKNDNIFISSFSIVRNWEKLTENRMIDSKLQDFQFIHGVRVICNLLTLLLHVVLVYTLGFTRNPIDIEKTFELQPYILLYNGPLMVQIFFFLSGFLKSLELQVEEEKRTVSIYELPKTMLLRFSRLVPVLAVVLALTTSWLRHLGSGPLWKLYVTDSLVADCRNCWWHHLFFINNYMQKGRFCLLPTWHLAADLQVFLIGVTAYLISRRVLLPALLLLGVASAALQTYSHDLDAVIITPQFFRTWVSRTLWLHHVLGHTNLPCFIIGMMTAVRLYNWQKKGGHLVESKWWRLMQYLIMVSIPSVLYLSGREFYSSEARHGLVTRVAYNATIRVILGLICVLGSFAFVSRTPTYLKSLFEWRRWTVLGRLTYCVFLVHMVFIHIMSGSRTQLSYYSFNNVMCAYVFIVLTSFLVSVPLYLLVEAPFTTLFKNLQKRATSQNISHKSTDEILDLDRSSVGNGNKASQISYSKKNL